MLGQLGTRRRALAASGILLALAVAPAGAQAAGWKRVAPLPQGCGGSVRATGVAGDVYAACYEGPIQAYHPATNRWTPVPPPPKPVLDPAIAGSGGRLYVFGGTFTGEPPARSWVYTPSTRAWAAIATLPTPRSGAAAVATPDGRISVLGGSVGNPDHNVAVAEVYAPATNSWTRAADLPVGRTDLEAAASPDGRVYALGGADADSDFFRATDEVDGYKAGPNRWHAVPPLPFGPAIRFGAVSLPDGRLFAIGGTVECFEGCSPTRHVAVFDHAAGAWSAAGNLPEPRASSAAVGGDGRIYLVGGLAGAWPHARATRTVLAFDPS
jgi:N-acetylneuraminic acid mutarotase